MSQTACTVRPSPPVEGFCGRTSRSGPCKTVRVQYCISNLAHCCTYSSHSFSSLAISTAMFPIFSVFITTSPKTVSANEALEACAARSYAPQEVAYSGAYFLSPTSLSLPPQRPTCRSTLGSSSWSGCCAGHRRPAGTGAGRTRAQLPRQAQHWLRGRR